MVLPLTVPFRNLAGRVTVDVRRLAAVPELRPSRGASSPLADSHPLVPFTGFGEQVRSPDVSELFGAEAANSALRGVKTHGAAVNEATVEALVALGMEHRLGDRELEEIIVRARLGLGTPEYLKRQIEAGYDVATTPADPAEQQLRLAARVPRPPPFARPSDDAVTTRASLLHNFERTGRALGLGEPALENGRLRILKTPENTGALRSQRDDLWSELLYDAGHSDRLGPEELEDLVEQAALDAGVHPANAVDYAQQTTPATLKQTLDLLKSKRRALEDEVNAVRTLAGKSFTPIGGHGAFDPAAPGVQDEIALAGLANATFHGFDLLQTAAFLRDLRQNPPATFTQLRLRGEERAAHPLVAPEARLEAVLARALDRAERKAQRLISAAQVSPVDQQMLRAQAEVLSYRMLADAIERSGLPAERVGMFYSQLAADPANPKLIEQILTAIAALTKGA